jgi:dCMP deaminase
VGAVLVDDDRRIVATGYNGSRRGGPSCLAGECPRGLLSYEELAGLSMTYDDDGPGRCVAIHAEINVVLSSDRDDRLNSTLYITREPCAGCLKTIQASWVRRIVWPEGEWLRDYTGAWARTYADEMLGT